MTKYIHKYWLFAVVLLINLITIIFYPQTGITALTFMAKNLLDFLFMLTPIFICIGLMDVWIERETMIKLMGDKSGLKGILISLLLGMVTAVPLYALLPVAGMLLKKDSRISNVLLFLCSSVSIRIPLLLFEVSSLGWRFTLARLILNITVVFVIVLIIDKTLSEEDKKAIYEKAKKL